MKIVRLDIKDNYLCYGEELILETFYLIDPDIKLLDELKEMIQNRFDYQYDDEISDTEYEEAEEFADFPWDYIRSFIRSNFTELYVDEYEIEY